MTRQRRPQPPVLPVPMPTCPDCGQTVDARLCQATPRTPADVDAIQAVVLAMHQRLAHTSKEPHLMPNTVEALKRIERLTRALRYRITNECIEPPSTRQLTDHEIAAAIVADAAIVLDNTHTPAGAIG